MEGKKLAGAFTMATRAHEGLYRKGIFKEEYITHPTKVCEIVSEYSDNEDLLCACLLHDVVEESDITVGQIKDEFGEKVADLVKSVTFTKMEKKYISWEERKQIACKAVRTFSDEGKLLVLGDKISNIESLVDEYNHEGSVSFDGFKRGTEKQEWYYRTMYESIKDGMDEEHPLLKRLETGINTVFGRTMEDYKLSEFYLREDKKHYKNIKRLDTRMKDFKGVLSSYSNEVLKDAVVIEFFGTPRTNKSRTISKIANLLEQNGIKTTVVNDKTKNCYYIDENKPGNDPVEYQKKNIKEIIEEIETSKRKTHGTTNSNLHVVLCDGALNNSKVLLDRAYHDDKTINIYNYVEVMSEITAKKDLIDISVMLQASATETLKREHRSILSLENTNLNEEIVETYNSCLPSVDEGFINNGNIIVEKDRLTDEEADFFVTHALINGLESTLSKRGSLGEKSFVKKYNK